MTATETEHGVQVIRELTIEDIWHDYKATGSLRARERLVVHYAPLVKYVAGRVGVGLPNTIESGDLVQNGMIGLLDAIDKFEPDRGLKFETYAVTRIRGAIIDELRALDWVPRSVRNKLREIQKAFTELEIELGRTATDQEVSDRIGMTVKEIRQIITQVDFTNIVALDELTRGADGDDTAVSLSDRLHDDRNPAPGAALEDEETRSDLAKAVALLPDRERIVVTLYYFENLTLSEIGKVLSVTESRACQLHSRAVVQLRAKMAALGL